MEVLYKRLKKNPNIFKRDHQRIVRLHSLKYYDSSKSVIYGPFPNLDCSHNYFAVILNEDFSHLTILYNIVVMDVAMVIIFSRKKELKLRQV